MKKKTWKNIKHKFHPLWLTEINEKEEKILDEIIEEAEAALKWRGNYDTDLKCLDPWTFAKVRRVEEALKDLLKEIKK